ncbi:MAG: hypothetical protein ACRD2N_04485 [Vicinamibacterales bacterium]
MPFAPFPNKRRSEIFDADDEFASQRRDVSQESSAPYQPAAFGDAVDNDGRPIGPHDPSSMPRAEDDAEVLERSPEFNDRPGSGNYR